MQNGVDVNIYRQKVDNLEDELKELYKLNAKLASIVLPIKKMYKDIVDELTAQNGEIYLKLKFKILIVLFSFLMNANAIDVLIVKKGISYKEKITTKKLAFKKFQN